MPFESNGLDPLDRYSRQIRFHGLGEAGQRRLMASRVTLCGCGALGTVLANHLFRAGVGHVGRGVEDADHAAPSGDRVLRIGDQLLDLRVEVRLGGRSLGSGRRGFARGLRGLGGGRQVLRRGGNRLVERFYAAEDAYRRDLSGALNYERERADFLAALSHELRTPLNVILGFADVLLSEVDGQLSPEARENLTVVRQSG